jgi:hypothetical protein
MSGPCFTFEAETVQAMRKAFKEVGAPFNSPLL